MKLCETLKDYIDERIFANAEAQTALKEFCKKLPGRLLEVTLDTSKTNKVGYKDGDRLFKLGFISETQTAFVEYYENSAQTQPTMMLLCEKTAGKLVIKGTKVAKTFYLGFYIKNGVVERVQKTES